MTAKLYTFICGLHNDLRGQDLVEYALMAGGIGFAIISTVFALGEQVKATMYDKLVGMF